MSLTIEMPLFVNLRSWGGKICNSFLQKLSLKITLAEFNIQYVCKVNLAASPHFIFMLIQLLPIYRSDHL